MAVQDVYKSTVDNYANRIAQAKKNRLEDEAAVTNRYNTSVSQLGKSRDKAMREAYITREQSKRDVPTMLAQQGITGGATETTLSNLYRNYMNARNAANESYDTNKVTLDNEYQTNMLKLRDSYDDTIANLEDKKNAADIEYQQYLANMLAQAAASSGGYGGSSGGSIHRVVNNPGYTQQQRKYNAQTTNNYAWQNRTPSSTTSSSRNLNHKGQTATAGKRRVRVGGNYYYV